MRRADEVGVDKTKDHYAVARGVLTSYDQTMALTELLMEPEFEGLRYKTLPDAHRTVQSYMSSLRYTTPLRHCVGTAAGVILHCASHPITQPMLPMGRRVADLLAGGKKRDAITLRIFEAQINLLEGDMNLRCSINFAAMKEMARKKSPLFKDNKYA